MRLRRDKPYAGENRRITDFFVPSFCRTNISALTCRLFCYILYATQHPHFVLIHQNNSPPFRSALLTGTQHADLEFQIYFQFWHFNVTNIYSWQRIPSRYQKNTSLRNPLLDTIPQHCQNHQHLNHSCFICAGFISLHLTKDQPRGNHTVTKYVLLSCSLNDYTCLSQPLPGLP